MAKTSTPIQTAPWVEYQGDLYMGEDGTCYVMTIDPKNTDKLGNLIPLIPPTLEELTWKQEKPGMSQTHLSVQIDFENKLNDRSVLRTILLHKVQLDDPTQF